MSDDSTATAEERAVLGIVYCPACRQDTVTSERGECLWHEPPLPITGPLLNERLLALAKKAAPKRERRRKHAVLQVCGGCRCPFDERNPTCRTCAKRHYRRAETKRRRRA